MCEKNYRHQKVRSVSLKFSTKKQRVN